MEWECQHGKKILLDAHPARPDIPPMPNIITVKVDCALIDKARLFTGKVAKDGHTPKYLDLVLIPRREVGTYGATHLVKQSVTKEEREAKLEMPILGDATERGGQAAAPTAKPKAAVSAPSAYAAPDKDDIGF